MGMKFRPSIQLIIGKMANAVVASLSMKAMDVIGFVKEYRGNDKFVASNYGYLSNIITYWNAKKSATLIYCTDTITI